MPIQCTYQMAMGFSAKNGSVRGGLDTPFTAMYTIFLASKVL